jgi:hypothetical protein
MKTYVYENIEVKQTGRSATRSLGNSKVEELVEITPVHDKDGLWFKWVPAKVLFVVKQIDEDK